jgi:fermentation-respiration switch protein FrsA (DUF1100 family)
LVSSNGAMKVIRYFILWVVIASLLSGCKAMVNSLAFHPDNSDVISTKFLPIGVEERTIETEDKVLIRNLYLPTDGSNKIVIYFHGNAGNIYHRIPSLMLLQKAGVNVLGVSYRGYGRSEGSPSEEGIYLDGKAAFSYVRDELGFAEENIVVIGRSIGTTVAINMTQNRDIGGLILVSPLTSGKAQASAGTLSLLSSLAGNAFNNLSKIENIRAPVLVIHGTKDRVIPYSMGRELFNAINSPKEFVAINGAGHNDLQGVFAESYWLAIYRFLKRVWN